MDFKNKQARLLFLKYAIPCSKVLIKRGAVSQKTINKIIAEVRNNSAPKDSEKIFKFALKMCRKIAGRNPIDEKVIRNYFWFAHDKTAAKKQKIAKDFDLNDCIVYPGKVLKAGQKALVETPIRTKKYKSDFCQNLKVGDKVLVHYDYITEKISKKVFEKLWELKKPKTIYVFGNPLVKEDSLPLSLIGKLKEEFPLIEFKEFDTTEDLKEKNLNIIDTVKGIKRVKIIEDIDKIITDKVYSLHDFDLGYNLKLMKKLKLIKKVRIFGIPIGMKKEKAFRQLCKLLSKKSKLIMKLIHLSEPRHSISVERKIAKQILKAKPDAILFEFPKESFCLERFNRYKPENKPKDLIENWKKSLSSSSKKYTHLKGEIETVKNIEKLWNYGHQVYLFEIDAPVELTRLISQKKYKRPPYNLLWNYLRERLMVSNIKNIFKNKKLNKPKILIKCHNFHWKNIKFLLKNPGKKTILDYYFSGFSEKQIKQVLRNEKILLKYWKIAGLNHLKST